MVWESWLRGRGTRIITKSIHLYDSGRLFGGRGTIIIANSVHLFGFGRLVGGIRNHCNICAFVLFWKVGWGSGAPEIIAKLMHLLVLEGLFGGRGTINHCKNKAFI